MSTATANPFENLSKPKAEAKSKAKEKKEIELPGKEQVFNRIAELTEKFDSIEAELKMLKGEIKDDIRPVYLDVYKDEKKQPESFKIFSGKSAKLLVMVIDRYLKVEGSKIDALKAFPDVLSTTTTYTLNPEVMAKYSPQIGAALMSAEIPDEVKGNLLLSETKHEVKKGTISRLLQYDNPDALFQVIEPIIQLKNTK